MTSPQDTRISADELGAPLVGAQILSRFMRQVASALRLMPDEQWAGPFLLKTTDFPFDFACSFPARPRGILLAAIRDSNGAALPTLGQLDAEFITKRDQPHIRLRNLSGLTAGRTYEVTVLVRR